MGLPGPGQYNPNSGSVTLSSKYNQNTSKRGAGFGSEKRAIGGVTKSMSELPGPGQYTIDHDSYKGPKIGFGTSTRDKGGIKNTDSLYVPGPGQYAFDDPIGKSGPKVSMKFRPATAG